MMPTTNYYVRFVRKDNQPGEVYSYPDKKSALEHFRLFYESESAKLYDQICVSAYDWNHQTASLIGLLTFIEKDETGITIKKVWRNWTVGRPTIWEYHAFDGYGTHTGYIAEVTEDHALMVADGMRLWIDDDSVFMFR